MDIGTAKPLRKSFRFSIRSFNTSSGSSRGGGVTAFFLVTSLYGSFFNVSSIASISSSKVSGRAKQTSPIRCFPFFELVTTGSALCPEENPLGYTTFHCLVKSSSGCFAFNSSIQLLMLCFILSMICCLYLSLIL